MRKNLQNIKKVTVYKCCYFDFYKKIEGEFTWEVIMMDNDLGYSNTQFLFILFFMLILPALVVFSYIAIHIDLYVVLIPLLMILFVWSYGTLIFWIAEKYME